MSDIIKSAAGGIAKKFVTGVLAAHGVPTIVGSTAADIVAGIASKALNANDAAAQAEFERIKEDILFELAAKEDKYNDKRPPSPEDVHAGLVRFVRTYQETRDHKKRRVLFNAFYNSFQPGYYDEGVSKILWDKVERLEYPDFFFLHRLLKGFQPNLHDEFLPSFRFEDHPPILMVSADEAQIEVHIPQAEFAERLAREGLLRLQDSGTKHIRIRLKGFADELRDFALREAWRAEPTDQTLDGQRQPQGAE